MRSLAFAAAHLLGGFCTNFAPIMEDIRENDRATAELGSKPVGSLLAQYAVPAVIAMTASSLYNMIDSIYIGQGAGPAAISGLAITFPFMNLSTAFGAAIGVGACSVISMKLGQKDYSTAEVALGNTVTLNVIVGLLFTIAGLVFMDPVLRFFGASDLTLPYARDYMQIIIVGNVFTHLYFALNGVLRASGNPRKAMYATIFTVVLNTAVAPVFIWPLGMGIKGAALATVLAQVAALCWQVRLFSSPGSVVRFRRSALRLDPQLVKNIVSIGISPFSMQVCACIVVIFINTSFVEYGGDMAVGAFGIANKVGFVFVMIAMGINQGMQPIAGYNYGAQKIGRMLQALKYAAVASTAVVTAGWAVAEFAPYYCARLFTTDSTLIALSERGIELYMMLFPIVGFQMVATSFFQSIGKAGVSIFLSLSRQLVFLVPLLVLLPPAFGVDGIWAALPASDGLSAVVSALMLWKYVRMFNKQRMETEYGNTLQAR